MILVISAPHAVVHYYGGRSFNAHTLMQSLSCLRVWQHFTRKHRGVHHQLGTHAGWYVLLLCTSRHVLICTHNTGNCPHLHTVLPIDNHATFSRAFHLCFIYPTPPITSGVFVFGLLLSSLTDMFHRTSGGVRRAVALRDKLQNIEVWSSRRTFPASLLLSMRCVDIESLSGWWVP